MFHERTEEGCKETEVVLHLILCRKTQGSACFAGLFQRGREGGFRFRVGKNNFIRFVFLVGFVARGVGRGMGSVESSLSLPSLRFTSKGFRSSCGGWISCGGR